MAEICLIYNAQVHVTVDTESGEVTAVNVDDEGAIIARNDAGVPETDDFASTVSDVLKAYSIAESTNWPAWELGF